LKNLTFDSDLAPLACCGLSGRRVQADRVIAPCIELTADRRPAKPPHELAEAQV
jgi:hypothetical protein